MVWSHPRGGEENRGATLLTKNLLRGTGRTREKGEMSMLGGKEWLRLNMGATGSHWERNSSCNGGVPTVNVIAFTVTYQVVAPATYMSKAKLLEIPNGLRGGAECKQRKCYINREGELPCVCIC